MTVMLMLALLAGSTLPQGAVETRGRPRWPKGDEIRVWIDSANAPPAVDILVERAMDTWTNAADGRFRLEKTAARDGAALRVHFVRGDSAYGETFPRVDGRTGSITEADVAIAADAPALDPLDTRIIIYLTALHELGHALGLRHTDDFDDIMYGFRRPDDGERYFGAYRRRLRSPDDIGMAGATGLSAEDVLALRELYDR